MKKNKLCLLPQPQEIQENDETFLLTYDTPILLKSGWENRAEALLLQKEIEEQLGFHLSLICGREEKKCISLFCDHQLETKSYRLSIKKDGIVIAGGKTGVMHGVQTLRQIIRQEGAVLSGIEIKDRPSVSSRGFYHDITRGRVPTLESLKQLADTLSFYKMNQLQLYVEHSYLFADFSEVWRDDTPLTAEEIMELDRYCQNLHIDLVPSLSCFGHLYKLLQTKSYRHLCEREDQIDEFSFVKRMHHHTLDISNDESFRLVCEMIGEYMPLFNSRYFNIGADETFDLGKGKSKELVENVGKRQAYTGFVNKICRFVVEQEKIPMFWGDVIVGFPEAVKDLPEETICLNWGYMPTQREDETRILHEAGAVQYVCPGVCGWNQLINLIEDSYENITRMCSYAVKYGAKGVLNTDWGDYGHINHPEFSAAGIIYGANFSWNSEPVSFQEINRRISVLEYGDPTGRLVDIFNEMAVRSVYNWKYAVELKEREHRQTDEDFIDRDLCEIDQDKTAEANQKIKQLQREVYEMMIGMETGMRKKVKAYLLASDGIVLWNEIGVILNRKDEPEKKEKQELAARLEGWYQQYKELWRSVSKESELYRISEVVFWYADLLRA